MNIPEKFDVYDINRKKTGRIINRGENLNEDEYHIFVQVWFYNSSGEFLFEKRSSTVTSPNKWCAAGGNVMSGEDSLSCTIREMKEELGLDITKLDGGLIDSRIYTQFNQHYFCDTYLYKLDKDISELLLQKEEVSEVKFIKMNEFKKMMNEGITFTYWLDYLEKLEKKMVI